LLSTKLDAGSKFKLLDMFDQRPISRIDHLSPENRFSIEDLDKLMSDQKEFSVWDDYIPEELLRSGRLEANMIHKEGQMKDAGFGKEK